MGSLDIFFQHQPFPHLPFITTSNLEMEHGIVKLMSGTRGIRLRFITD